VIFLLVVASFFIDLVSEAAVKLIDIEDTVNISILHGHNDVVRKVTWEPSGTILVCCPAL
jgi:WD40 repeat protein